MAAMAAMAAIITIVKAKAVKVIMKAIIKANIVKAKTIIRAKTVAHYDYLPSQRQSSLRSSSLHSFFSSLRQWQPSRCQRVEIRVSFTNLSRQTRSLGRWHLSSSFLSHSHSLSLHLSRQQHMLKQHLICKILLHLKRNYRYNSFYYLLISIVNICVVKLIKLHNIHSSSMNSK